MLVIKFGGTSVQNIERIKACARHVMTRKDQSLIVVVSAMRGVTDELCDLARNIDPEEMDPEHDVVRSAGEQITAGLFTLALKQLGLQARSYLAWQLPIYTDTKTCHASIRFIETKELLKDVEQNVIPVIAGFQGTTTTGRLTTLGRGGSDLTAVALACAIQAKRCDMYKDVNGIYTADPHLHAAAKHIPYLSYEQMLRIIQRDGAKVLQEASVHLAQKYSIPIYIRSSFEENTGTLIGERLHEFS